MFKSDFLFWNVDTQFDFVSPKGKLYVQDAEQLKPIWEKITELARKKNIQVINTADFHFKNSAELSDIPDYINTFPEHCMANSEGAEYIAETKPENPVIIDWDKKLLISAENLSSRNIIIRKDAFDVFKGNPYADNIVKSIAPTSVIVYGVTTNVCVNDAVIGLAKRVEKVYVIGDAIKELPNIPLPFANWKTLDVELIRFNDLENLIN